jgi:CheY-like chemotaxis protein
MAAHILSISYDESLLLTRALVLKNAGYQVTSALGYLEALRLCKEGIFDLAIIGHSIPRTDKAAILAQTRSSCNAPVISLYKTSEGPLDGVDYALDGLEGPEALLALVHQALLNAVSSPRKLPRADQPPEEKKPA